MRRHVYVLIEITTTCWSFHRFPISNSCKHHTDDNYRTDGLLVSIQTQSLVSVSISWQDPLCICRYLCSDRSESLTCIATVTMGVRAQ